ncbi:MAG: hypothetical protein PVF50_08775 [Gammaproteobacteria bacterium]|jgi:hypothetical protein
MTAHSERRSGMPRWGSIALPACALWGALLGVLTGLAFGNIMIGAAIGAGLGVGIGIVLLAAAIVRASHTL